MPIVHTSEDASPSKPAMTLFSKRSWYSISCVGVDAYMRVGACQRVRAHTRVYVRACVRACVVVRGAAVHVRDREYARARPCT